MAHLVKNKEKKIGDDPDIKNHIRLGNKSTGLAGV